MVATNLKSIGKKIKDSREKARLTQAQLADFWDLDVSYVSKIEKGELNVGVDLLEKTANLFGCFVDYFMDKDNNREPIPLTLRASNIAGDDLKAIARINKLALNLRRMSDALS